MSLNSLELFKRTLHVSIIIVPVSCSHQFLLMMINTGSDAVRFRERTRTAENNKINTSSILDFSLAKFTTTKRLHIVRYQCMKFMINGSH